MTVRVRIETDPETIEWKSLARAGEKVAAIRSFRILTGAGLADAKSIIETYIHREQNKAAVTTTTVQIPGGTLTIVSNEHYASILYTRQAAVNVPVAELQQAIADAAIQFADKD